MTIKQKMDDEVLHLYRCFTHTPCRGRVLFRKTCISRIVRSLYGFDTALSSGALSWTSLGCRVVWLISLSNGAKSVDETHIIQQVGPLLQLTRCQSGCPWVFQLTSQLGKVRSRRRGMRCRWRHNINRCIRMVSMGQGDIKEMAPIIRCVACPIPIAG